MISPELRELFNAELDGRKLPSDPLDCHVAIQASICPKGEPGEELFEFSVVTPKFLARSGELPRWGRGLLLVEEFSWEAVERAIDRLLMHAHRPTWREAALALSRDLDWEFDNYTG